LQAIQIVIRSPHAHMMDTKADACRNVGESSCLWKCL